MRWYGILTIALAGLWLSSASALAAPPTMKPMLVEERGRPGTADYIVGMNKAESRALLARLQDWAAQPAFSRRSRSRFVSRSSRSPFCARRRQPVPVLERARRRWMSRATCTGTCGSTPPVGAPQTREERQQSKGK